MGMNAKAARTGEWGGKAAGFAARTSHSLVFAFVPRIFKAKESLLAFIQQMWRGLYV